MQGGLGTGCRLQGKSHQNGVCSWGLLPSNGPPEGPSTSVIIRVRVRFLTDGHRWSSVITNNRTGTSMEQSSWVTSQPPSATIILLCPFFLLALGYPPDCSWPDRLPGSLGGPRPAPTTAVVSFRSWRRRGYFFCMG